MYEMLSADYNILAMQDLCGLVHTKKSWGLAQDTPKIHRTRERERERERDLICECNCRSACIHTHEIPERSITLQ